MPAIKQKVKTISDKIIDEFKEHQSLVDTILKSNAFSEDAEVEIESANEDLREDIIELFHEEEELHGFDEYMEKLKYFLEDNSNHLSDDDIHELLDLIEKDSIINYLDDKDYLYVQIKSADKRAKLEEFLKTEIFPFYNDQESALTNMFR